MSLKAIFNIMKNEGYIVKDLDLYLLSLNAKDSDRAIDVNSPSQASKCMRANYYSRTQVEPDGTIEPRLRRIFDNGTKTHERLQEYLTAQGMLILDEVPCIHLDYNIQGHTDGFLLLGKTVDLKQKVPSRRGTRVVKLTNYTNIGILEIKSINNNGFTSLKDAKPDHKEQAMIYLYCAEQRRLFLRDKYKSYDEFVASYNERSEYFAKRYSHLKGGKKFSTEDKLYFQVERCLKADTILYNTINPLNKVVFLYESKDTQELKEFTVTLDNTVLDKVLDRFKRLNEHVAKGTLPERECPNKSCQNAKWCSYKIHCFL